MSILIPVVAFVLIAVAAVLFAVRWHRGRGARVITCPDNEQIQAVEVDAARAALTSIFLGRTDYQLTTCTRWPEKAGCGQECVTQIHVDPHHCLVRSILADWYLGRSCLYCGKPFGEIDWHDHKPALYDPSQEKTVEWTDIHPELVFAALETMEPVCWNCHIAETFRREHGDLVTDRRFPRQGAM